MDTMSCEKHLGMGTVQNCAPCLQVELDYVRSENEALRADVVWVCKTPEVGEQVERIMKIATPLDADILRAVREARER